MDTKSPTILQWNQANSRIDHDNVVVGICCWMTQVKEVRQKKKRKQDHTACLIGEMKRLHTSCNPTMGEDYVETAFVGATTSDFTEPKDFKEAWYHSDPDERKFWR